MLMPPDADDLKVFLDTESLKCLKTIAEKYSYALKNEPSKELVVIYKPLKEQ
jgi:hypothetical protein